MQNADRVHKLTMMPVQIAFRKSTYVLGEKMR